jgi:hypothetical protein
VIFGLEEFYVKHLFILNKTEMAPCKEQKINSSVVGYTFIKEVNVLKCNVGQTEKTIRISLGSLIILVGIYFKSWWGLIGLAPIITGIIGWCPVSRILGVSTCKSEQKD